MTWFISFDGKSISMFYDKKVCFNRVKNSGVGLKRQKSLTEKKTENPIKVYSNSLHYKRKGI